MLKKNKKVTKNQTLYGSLQTTSDPQNIYQQRVWLKYN
jgi:hypothetical protein